MNDEIRAALRQTKELLGEKLLDDRHRVGACLADLLKNQYPGERRLLLLLMEAGIPGMIRQGQVNEGNIADKARYLAQTYFADKAMLNRGIRVWYAVLLGAELPELPTAPQSKRPLPNPAELIEAAENGDVKKLTVLLAAGAAPNVKDEDGFTALELAAEHGHSECVRLLIEAGADVNAAQIDGRTALIAAMDHVWFENDGDYEDCVRQIIEAGADVNAGKGEAGETPLMYAVRRDSVGSIRLLIEAGAEVNAKDRNGWTALHHSSNVNCLRLLIDAGADVNAKDKNGRTVLNWAKGTLIPRLLRAAGARE